MKRKEYFIYVLIWLGDPVYVGLSVNYKNRISKHKKTKSFDSYLVLRSFTNKQKALDYEKGIIDFMTFFHKKNCLNDTNPLISLITAKTLKSNTIILQ